MTPHDLINFGNLSRLLAGSRNSITRNRIPAKHAAAIQELTDAIGAWIDKNQRRDGGKSI